MSYADGSRRIRARSGAGKQHDLVPRRWLRQRDVDVVVHRVEGLRDFEGRVRLPERTEEEERPAAGGKLPDVLPCALADPRGLGISLVDSLAEGIFARRHVTRQRPVGDAALRITSLSPGDVVGKSIQLRHAVVKLDKIESSSPGFGRVGRVVMQLADRRRHVSGIPQAPLHQHFAAVQGGVIDSILVGVWIAAGEITDPRRYTNWGLHEAMREVRALCRQPIEMRRFDDPVAVGTKTVPTVLVGHHEENVRPVGTGISSNRAA